VVDDHDPAVNERIAKGDMDVIARHAMLQQFAINHLDHSIATRVTFLWRVLEPS